MQAASLGGGACKAIDCFNPGVAVQFILKKDPGHLRALKPGCKISATAQAMLGLLTFLEDGILMAAPS